MQSYIGENTDAIMHTLLISIAPHQALVASLEQSGHRVTRVEPGAALWAIGEQAYDVMIYDRPEARPDDFRACILDHTPACLIIAMIYTHDPAVRVALLNDGADACLVHPVSARELAARMAVFERQRENHRPSAGIHVASSQVNAMTSCTIQVTRRKVKWRDLDLTLRAREFAVLLVLARARGAAVANAELWNRVWTDTDEPNPDLIALNISRLRRALGPVPLTIETARGFGYRLIGDIRLE